MRSTMIKIDRETGENRWFYERNMLYIFLRISQGFGVSYRVRRTSKDADIVLRGNR